MSENIKDIIANNFSANVAEKSESRIMLTMLMVLYEQATGDYTFTDELKSLIKRVEQLERGDGVSINMSDYHIQKAVLSEDAINEINKLNEEIDRKAIFLSMMVQQYYEQID